MCSWCWGFEKVKKQLFNALPENTEIHSLVGGLAADSMVPMPNEMQKTLKQTWRKIEKTIPGTQFNYNFWDHCLPRRSTYPANRAVIAARLQGHRFDSLMTLRIQQAYYLEAKNPSDTCVLIALAADIGLDKPQFELDLLSDHVEQLLQQELNTVKSLGVYSFPSLILEKNKKNTPIRLNYTNVDVMIEQIYSC